MLMKNLFGSITLGGLLLASPAPAAETSLTPLDVAKLLDQAFVEVSERVSKSVVVISVVYRPDGDDSRQASIMDQLRRYFDMDEEDESPGGNESSEEEGESTEEAETDRDPRMRPRYYAGGSGFIIREDGYILTNHHVVENADEIGVRLQDGRRFEAEVVGTDELSEIAVIKLIGDDVSGLPVVKMADSNRVRVGQYAIAIGAPLSLDYTVTVGNVSAKGRSDVISMMQGGRDMDQDFIQTDAMIHPGSSGGPLINIDGEVMGVNTMIYASGSRFGTVTGSGIGFAVPSNLARQVSDQLIEKGVYERAWLGVGITELLSHPNHEELAPGRLAGVVVAPQPNTPASRSDLRRNDVVVAVNDVEVRTPNDLKRQIRSHPLGATLELDVVRRGRELRIEVSTGTWAAEERAAISGPYFRVPQSEEPDSVETATDYGISVRALEEGEADELGLESDEGVLVTGVEEGSVGAEKGIQAGHVITEVNRHTVNSVRDFARALRSADSTEGVVLNYFDNGTYRFKVLKE